MHEALCALPKVANTYSLHKQRKMYKYKHTKNYHRVAQKDRSGHARTHLGNAGTAPDSLAHNVHKVLYFCALPRRRAQTRTYARTLCANACRVVRGRHA